MLSASRLVKFSTAMLAVAGLSLVSAPTQSASGIVHGVQGRGWSGGPWGEFEFHISVRESEDGRVWGWSRFHYFEAETGFELRNAARIDCLDVDTATGEAWASGVVTRSEQPDLLPVGSPVLGYYRDGGPKGRDSHYAGSLPDGQSCLDRPDVSSFTLQVQRGNYVVR
jgi:hypothetical protein